MPANVQTMFSVKERPWHGLGTVLPMLVTAAEAIVAAGLDWEVEARPTFWKRRDGTLVPSTRSKAIVRADNQVELGVVGRKWEPVQNRAAFDFFDHVVGKGEAVYETAGALGEGERIWILAKLPDALRLRVAQEDVTEKFLLFSNNHDGSGAIRMFFTPVRVVCQNTLCAALKGFRVGEEGGLLIRHTKNVQDKVNEAQRALGLAVKFYDELGPVYDTLAERRASKEAARAYFRHLFPIPAVRRENPEDASSAVENERAIENAEKRLVELEQMFELSPTCNVRGAEETWWSAYNAATGHVDHEQAHRGQTPEETAQNRLKAIWFGAGALTKRRALDLAVTMAAGS